MFLRNKKRLPFVQEKIYRQYVYSCNVDFFIYFIFFDITILGGMLYVIM